MKKIILLILPNIILASCSLSHAMNNTNNQNQELVEFQSSLHKLSQNTQSEDDASKIGDSGLTPLQEFLTKPAPKNIPPDVWPYVSGQLYMILRWPQNVNLINPKTGNTAFGDLIMHSDPRNNYLQEMVGYLIDAGACFDAVDSRGSHFCDLLERRLASGALTKRQYAYITQANPAVEQRKAERDLQRERD